MKFIVKLILIILLIPIGLVVVLASTIKFQLLETKFWDRTFTKDNVYVNLSNDVKTYAESQTEKAGGKTNDLKILTDIITPQIIKDFAVHNLDNSLAFANGKRKELIVYIPINQIPKEFAPKSSALNTEEIPLNVLLSKFNVTIGGDLPISQIAYLGLSINNLLIGSTSIAVLFIFLLFLLTKNRGRFASIGVSFILIGLVTLFVAKILSFIYVDKVILRVVIPPILSEISKTWFVVSMVLLGFGIISCFIKKPDAKRQI